MAPKQEATKPVFATIDGGSGSPPEPDWLVYFTDDLDLEFVRSQWRSIVNEMRDAQTLCADNGDVIKRLIGLRLEADRQLRAMGETGAIRQAKRTKVRQIDPSWTVFKQASEAAATLEAELALSPRRRNSGGKVQRKAKRATAADEFLNPVAVRPSHEVGKARR
jgi:hypothetical protein